MGRYSFLITGIGAAILGTAALLTATPIVEVQPTALAVSLVAGEQVTREVVIFNRGDESLDFSITVVRRDTGIESVLPPGAPGEFQELEPSEPELACVVADPSSGFIYARVRETLEFYRFGSSSGTWERLADAPVWLSLNECGGALLHGRVYLSHESIGVPLMSYDPASDTWTIRLSPAGVGTPAIASDGVRLLYMATRDSLVAFDPVTGGSTKLRAPPPIQSPIAAGFLDGTLYLHTSTELLAYDVSTDRWRFLTSLPEPVSSGGGIDPVGRAYYAGGSYRSPRLLRYSIDDGLWTVLSNPLFEMLYGDLVWLPGPTSGIHIFQGHWGRGHARLVTSDGVAATTTHGTVPPFGSTVVELALGLPSWTAGSYEFEVRIAGNDPDRPLVTVPVVLKVAGVPMLAARPRALDFGSTAVGKPLRKVVAVENRGTAPLEIEAVATGTAEFDARPARLSVPPGSYAPVEVFFDPSGIGRFRDDLVLTGNDPQQPRLEVALEGEGRAAPELAVDPPRIVSSVLSGDRKLQTLGIANQGDGPLDFSLAVRSAETDPAWCRARELLVGDGAQIWVMDADSGEVVDQYVRSQSGVLAIETVPGSMTAYAIVGETLTVLDLETGTFTDMLKISRLRDLALSQSGDTLVAIGVQLYVIDPTTGELLDTLGVGYTQYTGVALDAAGRTAYVPRGDALLVVDLASGEIETVADVPGTEVDVDPSGSRAWVAGPGGDLYEIELATHEVELIASGLGEVWDIELDPAVSRIYFGDREREELRYVDLTTREVRTVADRLSSIMGLALYAPRGCLGAFVDLDRLVGTVRPGEVADVGVALDATELAAGGYRAEIVVTSNDPTRPQRGVPVEMTVLGTPDIAVSGTRVTEESRAFYGGVGAVTEHRLAIPSFPAVSAVLEVTVEGSYRGADKFATVFVVGEPIGTVGLDRSGSKDCITLTKRFELDPGELVAGGILDVEVQNATRVWPGCVLSRHTVRLVYEGERGRIELAPTFVGASSRPTVRIENRGTAPLEIGDIRSTDLAIRPGLSKMTVPAASERILDVEFAPKQAGVVTGTMTIASNDPDSPVLGIELRGEGLEAPIIELSPEAVVSTVGVGDRHTETITVRNRGGSPLAFALSAVTGDPEIDPVDCSPVRAWITDFDAGTLSRFELDEPVESPLTDLLTYPGAVALSPDGRSAYVVENLLAGGLYRVDLVSGATTPIGSEISGGRDLALTDDGRTAIVLERGVDELSAVDLATGDATVIASDLSGGAVELDASGTRAWISHFAGTISELDLETGEKRDAFRLLESPGRMALDPTGELLYVTEHRARGGIVRIDLRTGQVRDAARGIDFPFDLAIDESGTQAWVVTSEPDSALLQVDLTSGISRVIATGFEDAGGIALDGMRSCLSSRIGLVPSSETVPPSESAEVELSFETAGLRHGSYRAGLEIASNDPRRPLSEVPVTIDIVGEPDLSVTSIEVIESTVEYTSAGAETTHDLGLRLPLTGDGTLEVSVQGNYRYSTEVGTVTLNGRELGVVGAAGGSHCTTADAGFFVALDDLQSGSGIARVTVRNSSAVGVECGPDFHRVRLSYRSVADTLEFGSILVGGDVERRIELRNLGAAELVVKWAAPDTADFEAEAGSISLRPGASAELPIRFAPRSAGLREATLTIVSNDPDEPEVTVGMSGTGVPAPRIGVQPASLESALLPTQRETRRLTLSNTGAGALDYRIAVIPEFVGNPVRSPFRGLTSGEGAEARTRVRVSSELDETMGIEPETTTFLGVPGDFELLTFSPAPLGCVVADPQTGLLYAQESGGVRFFRYSALSNTWESAADAPFGSSACGATFLDGRIYTAYTTEYDLLGVYEPATDSWSRIPRPVHATGVTMTADAHFLYVSSGLDLVRFDPRSMAAIALTDPPVRILRLEHVDGVLYAHRSQDFLAYDIEADSWTELPDPPSSAGFGSTVDPVAGEYVTESSYGGNVFRYSIEEQLWRASTVPFFEFRSGGMAWLPGPVPGVYFAEGLDGRGFARMVSDPAYIRVIPDAGTIGAGQEAELEVEIDPGWMAPGRYDSHLAIASTDPVTPTLTVPVALTVLRSPDIAIRGARVEQESSWFFLFNDTVHVFEIEGTPSSDLTVELVAEGQYRFYSDTATLRLEGETIGEVSGFTGSGTCVELHGTFDLPLADVGAALEDGQLRFDVENSYNVRPDCERNRHTVRLSYSSSIAPIDFGEVVVGDRRDVPLIVENRGTDPLVLTTPSGHPDLSVSPSSSTIPAGEERILAVGLAPTTAGAVSSTLTIASNDPDTPTIEVPVVGTALAPAGIRVEPPILTSEIVSGDSEAQLLTIHNDGAGPLEFEVGIRGMSDGGECSPGSLYVLESSSGSVHRIDLETGLSSIVADRVGGVTSPVGLAVDPSERHGYLAVGDDVIAVDFHTGEEEVVAGGFDEALDIELLPDRRTLLVTELRGGRLRSVDVQTGDTETVLASGVGTGLEVDPSGSTAYAVVNGKLSAIDLATAQVAVVLDETVTADELVLHPDGKRLFLSGRIGYPHGLYSIDLTTGESWFLAPDPDRGVEVSPSGDVLYIRDELDILRIDLEDGTTTTLGPRFSPPERLVHSPSACRVGFLRVEPKAGTVAGHEGTTTTVTFDARALGRGSHAAEIVLRTNDPTSPETVIPALLEVTGRPDLRVSGAVVSLESRKDWGSNRETFHDFVLPLPIVGDASIDLEISADTDHYSDRTYVSLEGELVAKVGALGEPCVPASRAFGLTPLELAGPAADGRLEFRAFTYISANCTVNSHTLRLSYTGPTGALDFGRVPMGGTGELEIILENVGGDVLEVGSIRSDNPAFTPSATAMTIPPGASETLGVTFSPLALPEARGRLVIESNDPDSPAISVELSGSAVASAEMTLDPVSLATTVAAPHRVVKSLTVSNDGPVVLDVDLTPRTVFGDPTGSFEPRASSPDIVMCMAGLSTESGDPVLYAQVRWTGFHRYDPAIDTWEALPDSPAGGSLGCRAVELAGDIYIAHKEHHTIAVFDPRSESWTTFQSPHAYGTVAIGSDGSYLYVARDRMLHRYDPGTGTFTALAPPPFDFTSSGWLVYRSGVIFGHAGTASSDFAAYDIATDRWRPLPNSHGTTYGAAAIDPVGGEIWALRGYYSQDLLRFSIHDESWATFELGETITTENGHLAWLSGDRGGLYVAKGRDGWGFGRLAIAPTFLAIDPSSASLGPGEAVNVEVVFDSAGLDAGFYPAELNLRSNDPRGERRTVRADLTVTGVPQIELLDWGTVLESVEDYTESSAETVHRFTNLPEEIRDPSLEVIVEGDYDSASAAIRLDGIYVGAVVGDFDRTCGRASGLFPLEDALAQALEDGEAEITLRNNSSVSAHCGTNRHTVRLNLDLEPIDTLEFGDLFVGRADVQSFFIRNSGFDVLEIGAVTAGVPEVVASLSDLVLDPGERVEVSVEFTAARVQPYDVPLYIATNDPITPVRTLTVRGRGILPPAVEVSPDSFEVAIEGGLRRQERTLHVRNLGGSDLLLETSVRSVTSAGHSAGATRGFGYQYKDSDEPSGPVFEWVEISEIGTELPFDRDDQTIAGIPIGFRFPFYGQGFETVNVSTNGFLSFTSLITAGSNYGLPTDHGPENLLAVYWDDYDILEDSSVYHWSDGTRFVTQYNNVRAYGDSRFTFQVVLYPDGTIVYQYLSASGWLELGTIGIQDSTQTEGLTVSDRDPYIHDGLAVELRPTPSWLILDPSRATVPPGEGIDLDVSIDATGLFRGRYEAAIELETNDPARPLVVLPVTMTVGLPRLFVDADRIDFGTVFVGQHRELAIGLRNDGDIPLLVGLSSADPAFEPVAGSLSIEPGSLQTLAVAFRPDRAGSFESSLRIASNDPAAPETTVVLTGTAIAPPVARLEADPIEVALPPGSSFTKERTVRVHNDGATDLLWRLEIREPGTPAWLDLPVQKAAGGPVGFGYRFRDSDEPDGPEFEWTEISELGTALDLTGDDEIAGPVDLGFEFPFYGDRFREVWICTNGYLSFSTADCQYLNRELPTRDGVAPRHLIAPYWTDLHFRGERRARYLKDGERFIVQYTAVDRYFAEAELTFQVVLHRSGKIVFQYLTVDDPLMAGTVGIQNGDATDGLQVAFDGPYAHDELAVEITFIPLWLFAEPTAGTLPPGGSEEIDLTVTAEALETGDFVASLDLRSNDPASPLLSHPVVLHARQVEASRAKFVPQALNLDSKGRRAFFDLRFQTEIDLSEIALETVRLLDLVPPESVEMLEGNDGVSWIRFMFDRAVVARHLARGENVEVFVRGEIPGKTWFIGSDTIRVVSTAQRDPLGRSNEPTGSLNVPSRTRGRLRDVGRTRLAESDHRE